MDDLPIGRYGTIHYMSNNGSEVPLASYPVDEPIINLGRSDHNTCHIRLFDRWCSDIHCKLIFEEGKAFLIVLGQNGVLIDGSNFMPSLSETSPTTVPLTNGSEWLIFKRRFIFQYPPKEQRAKLMETPHKKSRKSLRMSMINAAQLWTPSAPKTQAESLQRLKSPVQPFPGEKGTEITLVEGDPVHFSHNQEEVVVVESVDSPTPAEPDVAPSTSARKPPQTPSKRGPPNLHKQVLLMNSHRKHVKSIDELEEREVEESILVDDNSDEELEEDAASNPFIGKTPSRTEREVSVKVEEPEGSLDGSSFTAKTFRASLGAIGSILPFGRPSGVVHSPNPPVNTAEEPLEGQEMDHESHLEHTTTPINRRPLGSFFTPQMPRGDQSSLPRQSVGAGVTSYMNLDNDVEEARRRLATLATIERPQIASDPIDQPVKPTPRSAKKPKLPLSDVPELSSPAKVRSTAAAMATISEPGTTQMEEDGEEVDHTASRLQRLMRTVEKEARRESIRESRQNMANPVEFYSPAGRTNPTKHTGVGAEQVHQSSPTMFSQASKGAHQIFHPKTIGDEVHASQPAETEEESDTSAKDSEKPVVSRRAGRAPAKQLAPVTGKRTVHTVDSSEDQMQVDEPAVSSEDVRMEDVEERPAKKARTARKAAPVAAPHARRTTKKTVAPVEEDNADEESGEVEENIPTSRSRSRRNLKAEGMPRETQTSKTAPVRRGGRSKATTPAADSVEEELSGSGTNSLVESEPVAPHGRGRRGKATTKSEPTSESVQEEEIDELDLLAPPPPQKAPARRAGTRGKAVTRRVEGDSSLADEDASASATTTKVAPKKAPARSRAKATAVEKESLSESEPVAPSKLKAGAKSRKAAVKEEQVDETSLDAKPRRTTRTKK